MMARGTPEFVWGSVNPRENSTWGCGRIRGCAACGHGETRDGSSAHQRLADRVAREIVHELRTTETYFDFGGMHVDVDFIVGHFQEEQRGGEDCRWQNVAIGLMNGVQDQAIAHQATIDENVDAVAIRALHLGAGRETSDGEIGATFAWIHLWLGDGARNGPETAGISTNSSRAWRPEAGKRGRIDFARAGNSRFPAWAW